MNAPIYIDLMFLGVMSSAVWVAALLIGWIFVGAWAWIDDSNKVSHNPVVVFAMRLFGYKKQNSNLYPYVNSKGIGADCFLATVPCALGAFLTPAIIYISVKFYPVPIAIVIFILLAHLARFTRRHKKVFDEHIKDNSAHL